MPALHAVKCTWMTMEMEEPVEAALRRSRKSLESTQRRFNTSTCVSDDMAKSDPGRKRSRWGHRYFHFMVLGESSQDLLYVDIEKALAHIPRRGTKRQVV